MTAEDIVRLMRENGIGISDVVDLWCDSALRLAEVAILDAKKAVASPAATSPELLPRPFGDAFLAGSWFP